MKKREQQKHNDLRRPRKRKQSFKFADNLSALIERMDWTHSDAAKIAGVSQATITSWTKGTAHPYDFDCVMRLAEEGRVDFVELLTGKKRQETEFSKLPPQLPGEFQGFEVDEHPQFEGAYWISVKKIRRIKGSSK